MTVADQNGQPVAGATVTFAVSGGTTTTRSCTTGANGTCSTSNNKVTLSTSKKSVTYTTTNVTKTGSHLGRRPLGRDPPTAVAEPGSAGLHPPGTRCPSTPPQRHRR